MNARWAGLDSAPSEEVIALLESSNVPALRDVTEINGTPIDMATILDASDADLSGRLGALKLHIERTFQTGTPNETDVGAVAREVLSQSKYEVGGESAWDRLGALLLAWFDQFIEWLTSALGGPTNTAIIFLAVVSVVGFVAFRFFAGRRSSAIERELTLERLIADGGDPDDLEKQADEAAASGRFETALRLRFLAGLLRLDLSGRITFRPGLTTSEIADTVDDRRFDRLVEDFNDVVYGGRDATSVHSRDAVTGWGRVLDEPQVPA